MRSKRILGSLLLALIASFIYAYVQMPKQERVSPGNNKANQQSQAKIKQQGQKVGASSNEGYPRLRSDLLERKDQPYPGVRRDLFSAAFFVEQIQEEIAVIPEEVPIVPVAPPPPPPPPTPEEVARQELSRYKFVGFFKKGKKQTIFLSSADEIFLLSKGDFLGQDHTYYVLNITDTTLELRKDGVGDFSIKLADQEFLSSVSLHAGQPLTPAPSGRKTLEQEINLPDQPELLPVSDEEPQTRDQLQPEEDNNETQN